LDEALDFMKQIRDKEMERATHQPPLQGQELQEFESNLTQLSQQARFHNMAAVDTSHTLALLTSCCDRFFCHSIIVERLSAMLNYFLHKLTGPGMKEFKVQNFEHHDFKPSVMVAEICKIYINLCHNDDFCQAISSDERSYSAELLPKATATLIKISQPPDMIQKFEDLTVKIQNAAEKQLQEVDLAEFAPEEFIDPIIGTLMKEPVMLPSSKNIVDKTTIARHILSDQSDPYNRSPLTLDQVIPQSELKERIEQWITKKRSK